VFRDDVTDQCEGVCDLLLRLLYLKVYITTVLQSIKSFYKTQHD